MDASKLGVSMSRIKRAFGSPRRGRATSSTPMKLEYQHPGVRRPRHASTSCRTSTSARALRCPTARPRTTSSSRSGHPRRIARRRLPFARWPAGRCANSAKRSEKSKCEQEIANYRRWSCRACRPPHRAARSNSAARSGARPTRITAGSGPGRRNTTLALAPREHALHGAPRRAPACSRSRTAGCGGRVTSGSISCACAAT